MTVALQPIPKGSVPLASDINQVVSALTSAVDAGQLTLAAPSANPTGTPTTVANGTGLLTGSYGWAYADVTGVEDDAGNFNEAGITLISTASAALTLSSNAGTVTLPASTNSLAKKRNVYRNKATGSASTGPFYYAGQVDVGTLVLQDNVPDTSLGALAPTANTTGTPLTLSTLTASLVALLGSIVPTGLNGLFDIDVDATNDIHFYRASGFQTWLDHLTGKMHIGGSIAEVDSVTTAGNFGVATVVASSIETLITGTAGQTIATFTPTVSGNYEIKVYFRVITGTTSVRVNASYNDASGSQSDDLLPTTSEAVGSYRTITAFVNATTGAPVAVGIVASVANQVYGSAVIIGY